MCELLQVERRGCFWFVRLNRPDKRNALSDELVEALGDTWKQIAADLEARALVLYGAGGNFCAGADLSGFLEPMRGEAGHGADPAAIHNRQFGSMLEALAALPVPTIAVVTGVALGGGCGLAAACDRVIAADDAVFATPEVTLGVAPAQIGAFVVRRVGATRGRWSMLCAARLTAAAAEHRGLADRVAPRAGLVAAVEEELRQLAVAEPAALRATKRIVRNALDEPLAQALDAAALEFAGLLRHGAVREGIAATREKRAPAWQVPVPPLPDFT